jgi:chromosome segregation ATPase
MQNSLVKLSLALPLIALVLFGCQDEKKPDLAQKGQEMASKLKDQVTSSLQQVGKDAKEDVLRAARAKAIELQGQLSEVKVPTKLQELQLGAINAQITKIDAALEEKSLQDRLDDAQNQAETAKANMEKGVKDAQAAYEKAQATAQELSDNIAKAQETYQDASSKFEDYMKQVRSLTGG